MEKSQPIRMCIACRSRYLQHTLIRLKQEGNDVIAYNGSGRSFYLCGECIRKEKKVKGLAKRLKVDKECFVKLLMELSQKVSSCDTSHSNEGVKQ